MAALSSRCLRMLPARWAAVTVIGQPPAKLVAFQFVWIMPGCPLPAYAEDSCTATSRMRRSRGTQRAGRRCDACRPRVCLLCMRRRVQNVEGCPLLIPSGIQSAIRVGADHDVGQIANARHADGD